MEERLQKIIAQAGIASRRTAEEYIKQGRIKVDGQAVSLGTKVDPEHRVITFDGKPVILSEEKIYLLLNKPMGFVTTMHDPQGRPVVTSLIKKLTTKRVFPVGRLDFNTEGALIFTNDGDFAQRLQHPSNEINKTYVAEVTGRPSQVKLLQLEKGLMLEGRKTWPARIKLLTNRKNHTTLEITIHEGRKRQVRKMFAAVGHPVSHLKRIAYGGLLLGNLSIGKARFLRPNDLKLIFAEKKNLYNSKGSG